MISDHGLRLPLRVTRYFSCAQAQGLSCDCEPLQGPEELDDDWFIFNLRPMDEEMRAKQVAAAAEEDEWVL